jgi:TRAP-type C4-dicarboxylate transport system substrate-binding protein
MWSNFWVVANADRFNALPPDLQSILRDAVNTYALSNRREMELSNRALQDKLARRGMAINAVDTTPFRAKLQPFYAEQKAQFGAANWALLGV